MTLVRPARPEELVDVGLVTAEAYLADGLVPEDDDYVAELRDAVRRAEHAVVLVAEDAGRVVGTATVADAGSPYAEVATGDELEVRMLAVAPEARGRGVGEALLRTALGRAAAQGRPLVLSTLPTMHAAHRMYDRAGLQRAPERDWSVEGWSMLVYVTGGPATAAPAAPAAPGVAVEAATWRPLRTLHVGGWTVGISGGVTRRANSAVPPAVLDPRSLDAVEAVYREHGLPAVVRVDRAGPSGLDTVLVDRGYRAVGRTDVLVRSVTPQAPSPDVDEAGEDLRVEVADRPDDAWLTRWLAGRRPPVDPTFGRDLLTTAPARYLTVRDADGVLGVARAARAGTWVGVSCVRVASRARRRGVGSLLTARAVAEAAADGATEAFLQVEESNVAARRLYTGLGFVVADRYHYRELPLPRGAPDADRADTGTHDLP